MRNSPHSVSLPGAGRPWPAAGLEPRGGKFPQPRRRVAGTPDRPPCDARSRKRRPLQSGRGGCTPESAASEQPLLPGLGKRFRGARHAASFSTYRCDKWLRGSLMPEKNSNVVDDNVGVGGTGTSREHVDLCALPAQRRGIPAGARVARTSAKRGARAPPQPRGPTCGHGPSALPRENSLGARGTTFCPPASRKVSVLGPLE